MKIAPKIIMSVIGVLAVLFLCVIPISLMATGSNGKEELPMFGNNPSRNIHYHFAKLYVMWTLRTTESRDAAYERDLKRGWIWFQQKDYRWAVKVFNRAWLIKPDDPRIFNAYGALAEVAGKGEEALGWYRRGAEKGDVKAKYNLEQMILNKSKPGQM